MTHRFRGKGLYILGDSEAALSSRRQLLMLRRIRQLAHQNSQFIVATHSPILLAYPNAKILFLDHRGFRQVNYVDTEHYQLARRVLNDTEELLKSVFADDGELFADP
jgi:predicted ATPase